MRLRGSFPWFILPLAFAASVLAMGLAAHRFEYDSDEGLNLIKGLMVARGHPLYSEMWSDQPPLFTWMMAGLYRLFGPSAMAARCLVLGFSTLLLVSFYGLVRRLEDDLAAALAVLFLVSTAWYVPLSFRVMIGLPAMAVGVLGLWLAAESRFRGGWVLAALSGLAMGLSLQVKLSSVTLVPALGALLLIGLEKDPVLPRPMGKRLGMLLASLGMLVAAWFAVKWLSGGSMDQLIHPHVAAARPDREGSLIPPLTLMRRDAELIVLALISLMVIPARGKLRHLLPLGWLLLASVAVQMHRPVWAHHGLLLNVPLSWAAALGGRPLVIHAVNFYRGLPGRWGRTDATCYHIPSVAIIAVVLVGMRPYRFARMSQRLFTDQTEQPRIVQELRSRAGQTTCVFSDRPIYAYYADLPVPPSLAVASAKRRMAGEMSDELMISELRKYSPEQVVVGRLKDLDEVLEYVGRRYTLVLAVQVGEDKSDMLYVRNDLVATAQAATVPHR